MYFSALGSENVPVSYTHLDVYKRQVMKYSLPIIPLKEFQFNPGSYVDWRGNIMNPVSYTHLAVHCRPETEGEGRRLEFGRRL